MNITQLIIDELTKNQDELLKLDEYKLYTKIHYIVHHVVQEAIPQLEDDATAWLNTRREELK